jgi:hypothetical protein
VIILILSTAIGRHVGDPVKRGMLGLTSFVVGFWSVVTRHHLRLRDGVPDAATASAYKAWN